MTVGAAIAPLTARPENGPRSAELAIGRRAFKQVWKGAVGWGLVFGAIAASSAQTYVTTFPTEASRAQLASLTGADPGLAVLLGPSSSIGTVGGYTVYKVFVTLTTIGAIWGLLVATRLLRGEEDTGRWQLVLAGSTRPDRATGATLAGLGAAVALVFLGTTLAIIAVGRSPDVGFGATESVLFGLSTIIAPAVFVAVGAMTSQLGRTRRVATGLGSAVLALAFVLRMIADTGPGTKWLLWLTPFGWVELMQPFTENNSLPLVPTTVCIIVLGYAAMVLAARRDAGDGILASTDVAAPRPFGLRSSLGLAGRLELPVLVGWCVGMAFAGIVCGIIIKMTTAAIPDSMRDLLDKFGVHGGFTNQYLGLIFLLLSTVVALLPAGQIGAACNEEVSGRLVHVLARGTSRAAWFSGRLGLSAAAIVLAGLLVGLGTWIGARTQGIDLDLVSMVGAGFNVIPVGLVALGIGAVVFARAPRAAGPAVYGVVVLSLVVDLLSSIVESLKSLDRLSLFHYQALAPAEAVEPTTIAVLIAVALGLCGLAVVIFDRRDLHLD